MNTSRKVKLACIGLAGIATAALGAAGFQRLNGSVKVGQGSAVAEQISFDVGSGSANPFIQSTSGGVLQLSTDGVHLLSIGTITGTLQTIAGIESPTNKTFDATSTFTGVNMASFTPDGGTHTLTFPAATDTVADLAGTQTFTNKTLTAPLFGSYADFTEISTPGSNPSSGKVRLYSKSGDSLFTLTPGGVESKVGSGSGEKNYVTLGTSSAAGWTASGSGVTVATDTTAADLPDISVGSALLITGVSGSSAYAFTNFTLDPADYGKKLKVAFDQACGLSGSATAIAACAASNFRVDVESCTVAWSGSPATTCGGTTTRLQLSTDSSAVSALPALTGTYRTTFDAPGSAAAFLQVRIGLNASVTSAIALANIVVGPGNVTQGAAITGWTTFTPTVASFTSSASSGLWRRVGANIEIQVSATSSSTVSGGITVAMPTGLTIDTTSLAAQGRTIVGSCGAIDSSDTARSYTGLAIYNTSTTIDCITSSGTATWGASTPFTWATADAINVLASIPVNEWAGSGTVNISQNDNQYAWNSTATSTTDTTGSNNGYGPGGVAFQSFAPTGTAAITKRVTFQYPIPVGTSPFVEVDSGTSGANWTRLVDRLGGPGSNTAGTTLYGTLIKPVSGSATQYDVSFFSTYDASTGDTWSNLSSWKWRVTAGVAGQAIGFGVVQPGFGNGLVSSNGTPVNATGNSAPSGYVSYFGFGPSRAGTGGSTNSTRATTAVTSSVAAVVSVTLNPGVYLIGATVQNVNASTGMNLTAYLAVGATQVTNTLTAQAIVNDIESISFGAVPVLITTAGTAVALYAKDTGAGTDTSSEEMWVTQIY